MLIRPRLQQLYLSGNRIESIKNIYLLKHLQELFVDENNLSSFSVLKQLQQLHTLNLNYNFLQILDVRNTPALISLHVDRNAIVEIIGLCYLTNLKFFSAESQRDAEM
jgi:Leucine-rich repeat (LRR) protein